MLPDFPALKSEIQKFLFARLQRRVDTGDPVLAQIKRFTQHEGSGEMAYEQYGGKRVQQGVEKVGAAFQIPIADVPSLIGSKLENKMEEIAQSLISEFAKLFYRKVGESCEEAGTSINAHGALFSAELLLGMLNTVETEFGLDGKPSGTFVIHPDMMPAVEKVSEQIENDPELKRRHDEILERQRAAWIARENNRKLAD